MTIALACDHAGYALKEEIKTHLLQEGYECKDFGTFSAESCDYPDYAYKAAKSVASGECERGVLVCGTGIGMSIVANKVKGIRCALCTEDETAQRFQRACFGSTRNRRAQSQAVDGHFSYHGV